jgi:hypothetical protein
MKWASFVRKAILIATVACLGLVPLEAHDPHTMPQNAGPSPLLKFASGSRIAQVYVQPAPNKAAPLPANGPAAAAQVQSTCEKLCPLGEAGFRLRPRLVTRLRVAMQAMLQGQPLAAARSALAEKLAVYDFDVLYGELPVVNASRTVLVSGGQTVAIRDRNPPQGLAKPVFPPSTAHPSTAWSLASKNSTDTLAVLYPHKPARLAADLKDPTAHLVLWPDQRARQLQLAWAVTVRSSSRTEPFLRRYWVSASQPVRILDFEDLIFYEQAAEPTQQAVQPPAPSYPFSSFPKFGAGANRPPVKIIDWPSAPPQNAAPQYGVAPTTTSPGSTNPNATAKGASGGSFSGPFGGSVSGTVTGSMWAASPYSGVVTRPLPGVELTVTRPSGISSTAYSDAWGRYSMNSVNGLATISATLSGPACKIINDAATSDDVATFSSRVGNGVVDVNFPAGPSDEFKLAQNSAFYSVNSAYDFVKGYLPEHPTKLPRLATHVNVDSSCNAYYDRSDNTLNFFRSFAGSSKASEKSCPNTAYRDVVYHEYGHAVDDELGGILDGAYSEGFGDCLSILITHVPTVGTDFYGPGKNLRDARKVFLWPKVKDSEIHEAGHAYSGFCWELTQQLQRVYGQEKAFDVCKQLILGAAAQNPKDIPDAVRLSFFLDEKLFPGSRAGESMHAAQLKAAARSRQLPIPTDASNLSSPTGN